MDTSEAQRWKVEQPVNSYPSTSADASRRVSWIWRGLLGIIILLSTLVPYSAAAQAQQPRVFVSEINGIFSALTADHAIRVLEQAEQDQVAALLLVIDSPGGTDRSVRRLYHALLTSEVPVIAYVGPEPGSAALSGAFLLTLAAHRTIMHPDATIGASTPAGISDQLAPEEQNTQIEAFVELASRTATIRERSPQDLEEIIREQQVFEADEALDAGIVDGIAESTMGALQSVDGETVQTSLGAVELDTENARMIAIEMTWWETTLQTITDPSVAYALLSIGLLLLVVELFNPGRLIAGIPAVICLVLAFVALGNLPISWLGLGLIILAAILFIAELRTPWIGVLGAIGLIAYIVGSLSLYRPWSTLSAYAPDVSVNPWVIAGTLGGWILVLLLTLRALFRARQSPPDVQPFDLAGHTGVVIEELSPRGVVRIDEQEWSAISEARPIEPGTEVTVERMAGGILYVLPSEESQHTVSARGRSGTDPFDHPAEPSSSP